MDSSRRICTTLFMAMVIAGPVAAAAPALTQVSELNAAGRPAGVPLDYVVTPHGFFHPSCVGQLGEDERLAADGSVVRPDGRVIAAAACAYPRYGARGELFGSNAEAGPPLPAFNGWIASSNSNANLTPPAREMVANFTVPSGPTANVGQVLYYFPGLEDGGAVQTILQPVLAWNGFNDAAWTMTNWNCCKSGKTWHGPTISVATGHKIHGAMKGSSCDTNTQVCANWVILSKDKTTGQKTKFQTDAYGQAFDWYFGGAKEAYGVSTCSHFPANGSIRFTNIHVYDLNGVETTPANWNTFIAGGAPPCNYVVTPTTHTTTITFDTAP
ncbi:hypothetical protein [Ideonella sp.]|uniref:hypothetical protein n=1 Tax=Ideonella sp. TaxID=1929293 RepID=UPI002B468C2C|nr:hypothetical protein [Ideonella sp.]HJV67678.1 hypothetical protein [Ideonella sp.]